MTSKMMESQCGVRSAVCGVKNSGGKNTGWAEMLFVLVLFLSGIVLIPFASPAVESAPAVTASAAPTDPVTAVEAHYRELVDLTAKVVQKNFLKSVGKTQTFDGSLFIKKPGKLRLEYTNGQVIVIDGKEVWFYSKKSAQAIRRTFKDFEQANIPVAFLLGAAHIRDDFEVVERKESAVRNTFDLTPRKKDAAMKKLGLVCDDGGRITGLIVYDKSGNTSSIAFSDVKENAGLDDQQFRFKVPKGTEVIEQ